MRWTAFWTEEVVVCVRKGPRCEVPILGLTHYCVRLLTASHCPLLFEEFAQFLDSLVLKKPLYQYEGTHATLCWYVVLSMEATNHEFP